MSAKYLQTIINASPTILLLALTTVIQATSPAAVDAQTKARILVGPNVLVSRMGDGNSWEHFVAANCMGTTDFNRWSLNFGLMGTSVNVWGRR